MGWNRGMSVAYSKGLQDGKDGKVADVRKACGFDSCYKQGHDHGSLQRMAGRHADLVRARERRAT